MKKYNYLLAILAFSMALNFTSCKEDEELIDDEKSTLSMEFGGLPTISRDQ